MPNLIYIRENGIEKFIEEQNKRIKLLETMIENFNDGKSKSFFCKSATLLDLTSLTSSLEKANQQIKLDKIKHDDVKSKAQILKAILNETTNKNGAALL